ncbi:MAG: EAL domain-containing protein [Paracoccus sp. (in: a-proteobacteria)]|uniref:EAL domain-containing protein n=1 Tax=Paracoccus sp. TaxID=267 RepID=UPI0039E6BBB1
MAKGIAARLNGLIWGKGAAARARPKAVVLLRLENAGILRASLGPAMIERMLQEISLRLTAELRFLPQGRAPGAVELCGMLADRRTGSLPGHLARLGTICRASLDLGEIRVIPVVNAVIVSDETGDRDVAALYAFGREALASCSPLLPSGQVRFVEFPVTPGEAVGTAEPHFSPDQIHAGFLPQTCCDTGRLVALRAVARVAHPVLGLLELEDFRARLSDEALAAASLSLLRQSLEALRGWDRLGRAVPFVTLPLMDRELADPAQADAILWELDRQNLPANRLEIEICEPIGREAGRMPATANLRRLAQAGCRIAMGNFGAGSAGLDDLRSFGVSRVRIDRSFVAGCDHRPDQQRMILAILALAEHLRLEILGDGVLTNEERSFLSQIGFNAVQGKAVSELLDAAQVDQYLLDVEQSLPPLYSLRRGA